MATQKATVANPAQYPEVPKGYYAQAFKKDKQEKEKLKAIKKLHKQLTVDDYAKEYTPAQIKKILNPRNVRLKD